MNILILVGIFLVALIAIVAVVLLVMGERGTETSAGNSAMMNPVAMPAAVTDASARTGAGGEVARSGKSATTVSLSSQGSDAATGRVASAPVPASVPSPRTRTFPSLDRESLPLTEAQEEPDGNSFNGQFHELSAELRALRAHAQEMEQRISMLMKIVERLEHDHGGLLDIGIDSEG